VVDDDSLACGQRQTEHDRSEPVNEYYDRDPVLVRAFMSQKYHDVHDYDQVQNLAAEPSYVADHQKLIGVLDGLAQRLVTSTKFPDASVKLAAAAHGMMEIFVQFAELVIQHAGDHVVY